MNKRFKFKNNNYIDIESIYYERNKLLDELYFKPGETFSFQRGFYIAGGVVTGSAQDIRFQLVLPKSLKNIKTVIVNSLNVDVRSASGGYLIQNVDVAKTATYNVSYIISTNNTIRFGIGSSSKYPVTNNTPCGVEIRNISLTFK